jgi:hypothetical protein
MPLSNPLSMFGWAWRVVHMVHGERGIGVGELSRGGSWTGALHGNSFEVLNEVTEDMGSMNLVHGGVERIASCHCWW